MSPINHRAMGERHGMWTGPELEHTQFHGLSTLFFSRYSALTNYPHFALRQEDGEPEFKHVFIALINPKFWGDDDAVDSGAVDSELTGLTVILHMIQYFLNHNKVVTVEVNSKRLEQIHVFTEIRKQHPQQFCLLLVVTMPELEAGAFAVKVAPPVVFENRVNEGCVMTLPSYMFTRGKTEWAHYAVDRDVELPGELA